MGGVADLPVRPPLQRRTREAWHRVLDAGVTLLEQGGYQAFTIAAVCERANVAPRAIYDRVDDKESLFLAVYEHGIARLRAEYDVLDDKRWRHQPTHELVAGAVREVAGFFTRHAAFLRAVVLISSVHPEVYRRGARHSQDLGDLFTGLLLRARDDIAHPDAEIAIRHTFTTIFSTLVLRTAYGPAFTSAATDDETFLEMLVEMAQRYLL
ncbi:TetR/AcrR family transcriptional regulator [Amycolatopsis bartoniae]|nr:TetR/AcrR family transcriptional regulator [Amycolatopsis bartoniae]